MGSFLSTSRHHGVGVGDRTTRASSSSAPSPRQNYEVFLSFRGEDTRHGFTDHLYQRLVDKGIMVYIDSKELHVGGMIDQLFEAIKTSKISIPIISPDYASSIWCLKELLQILHCMKTSGQLVLPIFYHVKPSDIREQKGDFGKKFRICRKQHDLDGKFVQDLGNAFKEVATLKGWEADKTAGGHEGELVKMVVTRIFNELRKAALVVPDFLVGVEYHVKKVKEMMDTVPSNEAKIIAIHGMGGIGKTTLAKALYNALSNNFECCSFVPNIREGSKNEGMKVLQKQMISDILVDRSQREISHVDEGITIIEKSFKGKRLLLLLDDVEDKDQLNKLAAKNSWFGSESIVVITTRNKHVAVASSVNLSYELTELNPDQSCELFYKHALRRDNSCPEDLEMVARDIVSTTGGLPLAIEVIGSLLCGESGGFWRDTLEKLRKKPNAMVGEKLKISYDALEPEQQQIFLDIACLSIVRRRFDPKSASYMWKSCGFFPEEGIERLKSLSLIKIGYENELIMHDQLKDLGREIVRREGCNNIGGCSRIFLHEEAMEVIRQKQGTPNVQALVHAPPYASVPTMHFTSQHFEGFTNLRFLRLTDVHLIGDFENHFLNLRWFKMDITHQDKEFDIMGINFNPKKLVVLDLFTCNITEHWKGWSQMKDLKALSLVSCDHLTTSPDFSVVKKLEVLIFSFCSNLKKIHPSIGKLSKTLKVLKVSDCKKLEELPIELGKLEELRKLDLFCISIREIPLSEGYLTKLERLSAVGCTLLSHIPDSIGKLRSLDSLDLRESGITELPDSIGELCNLEELSISDSPIKCLPASIGMLTKLTELDLSACSKLESLPNLPSSLTRLYFHGHSMETLPDISSLTNLELLDYMDLFERRNRALNLGNLNQLETLYISHTDIQFNIPNRRVQISDMAPENGSFQLELPVSLVDLKVDGCPTLHTLPNLSNLKNLSKLYLKNCSQLMEIQGLEGAESLVNLEISSCRGLSRLGGLSHLKMLRMLSLQDCVKLSDVQSIEKLTSLTDLSIRGCHPQIKFPNVSMLRNLKDLKVMDEKLDEIPGLQELKSLEKLNIFGCKSLPYLPDLSQLTLLKHIDARGCEQLTAIQGLENLTLLEELDIRGCTKLINLPPLLAVDVKFGPLEEEEDGETQSDSSDS